MARIKGDYDNSNKDDLQAEADARGLQVTGSGANGAVVKSDLVDALNASDGAQTTDDKTQADTGHPTPIIRSNPTSSERELAQPMPTEKDYKGSYVKNDNGETYGVAVVPNDPLGKTHKARNETHFWEGTKDEFKSQFEKK